MIESIAHSLQQGGFSPPRKGKHDDKAHPPIHPTAHAANLVGDQKKVYEYITRRFLACCSKDAEGWETTVDIVCGGEDFFATGEHNCTYVCLLFFTFRVRARPCNIGATLPPGIPLRQMEWKGDTRIPRRPGISAFRMRTHGG